MSFIGGGTEDQFDFFNVFLKDGEGFLVCSKFSAPKVRPVHKRLLRVNCIPTPIQSPKIVIEILRSNVIHVSEVEAHTIGTLINERLIFSMNVTHNKIALKLLYCLPFEPTNHVLFSCFLFYFCMFIRLVGFLFD